MKKTCLIFCSFLILCTMCLGCTEQSKINESEKRILETEEKIYELELELKDFESEYDNATTYAEKEKIKEKIERNKSAIRLWENYIEHFERQIDSLKQEN